MTAPSFSFTRYFFLPLLLAAPHAITENENMGRGKICGDKFFPAACSKFLKWRQRLLPSKTSFRMHHHAGKEEGRHHHAPVCLSLLPPFISSVVEVHFLIASPLFSFFFIPLFHLMPSLLRELGRMEHVCDLLFSSTSFCSSLSPSPLVCVCNFWRQQKTTPLIKGSGIHLAFREQKQQLRGKENCPEIRTNWSTFPISICCCYAVARCTAVSSYKFLDPLEHWNSSVGGCTDTM